MIDLSLNKSHKKVIEGSDLLHVLEINLNDLKSKTLSNNSFSSNEANILASHQEKIFMLAEEILSYPEKYEASFQSRFFLIIADSLEIISKYKSLFAEDFQDLIFNLMLLSIFKDIEQKNADAALSKSNKLIPQFSNSSFELSISTPSNKSSTPSFVSSNTFISTSKSFIKAADYFVLVFSIILSISQNPLSSTPKNRVISLLRYLMAFLASYILDLKAYLTNNNEDSYLKANVFEKFSNGKEVLESTAHLLIRQGETKTALSFIRSLKDVLIKSPFDMLKLYCLLKEEEYDEMEECLEGILNISNEDPQYKRLKQENSLEGVDKGFLLCLKLFCGFKKAAPDNVLLSACLEEEDFPLHVLVGELRGERGALYCFWKSVIALLRVPAQKPSQSCIKVLFEFLSCFEQAEDPSHQDEDSILEDIKTVKALVSLSSTETLDSSIVFLWNFLVRSLKKHIEATSENYSSSEQVGGTPKTFIEIKSLLDILVENTSTEDSDLVSLLAFISTETGDYQKSLGVLGTLGADNFGSLDSVSRMVWVKNLLNTERNLQSDSKAWKNVKDLVQEMSLIKEDNTLIDVLAYFDSDKNPETPEPRYQFVSQFLCSAFDSFFGSRRISEETLCTAFSCLENNALLAKFSDHFFFQSQGLEKISQETAPDDLLVEIAFDLCQRSLFSIIEPKKGKKEETELSDENQNTDIARILYLAIQMLRLRLELDSEPFALEKLCAQISFELLRRASDMASEEFLLFEKFLVEYEAFLVQEVREGKSLEEFVSSLKAILIVKEYFFSDESLEGSQGKGLFGIVKSRTYSNLIWIENSFFSLLALVLSTFLKNKGRCSGGIWKEFFLVYAEGLKINKKNLKIETFIVFFENMLKCLKGELNDLLESCEVFCICLETFIQIKSENPKIENENNKWKDLKCLIFSLFDSRAKFLANLSYSDGSTALISRLKELSIFFD